jgi:hypothetical protein
MIQLIEYLKNRPTAARLIFVLTVAVIIVWSLTVDTSHGHSWFEHYIPAFWSLFGIVSAVVLIFVARWYGRAGIEQEQDYYDN